MLYSVKLMEFLGEINITPHTPPHFGFSSIELQILLGNCVTVNALQL